MSNPHLFSIIRNKDESDDTFEFRCYENDVVAIKNISNKFINFFILPENIDMFSFDFNMLPSVVADASKLMHENNFDEPGPFKKAAAFCWSLMLHPPVVYRNADRRDMWNLSAFVAIRVTQFYIEKYLRDEYASEDINPPLFPSNHFFQDFIHWLIAQKEINLFSFTLLWELLTYYSNKNKNHRIAGSIDVDCPKFEIKGIKFGGVTVIRDGSTVGFGR